MHRRKTAKSISKPLPIQSAPNKTTFDDDNAIKFELELCWCVQQLQKTLDRGKLSPKVAEDTIKNLKTLTSKTAPLIKKRQVMKLALGDYRSKMQQEEKKMLLASEQIKFTTPVNTTKKSSFVKKSALLTSGKDFRFNFPVPPANNASNNNEPVNTDLPGATDSNTGSVGLQLSNGAPFKFNFTIESSPEDINFEGLMLNS